VIDARVTVPSPRARIALLAFVLAMLTIHGIVAYLSPLVGEDWGHWQWARGDGTGAVDFLAAHRTLAELVGYALAQSRLLHAIATPLASLGLLVGLFVLAARRLPRADVWDDVVALIVLSALIWIGCPRAGLVYFSRPLAAAWIYGGAATVWLLAPLRCGWRLPLPLAIAGGLVIGAGTRQLGTLALVLAIRERRHRALIAALALGNVVLYALPPYPDFRGWKPGFEASLNSLYLEIKEGGELISLIAALAFAKLLVGMRWPRWAGEPAPVVRETLPLVGFWLFAAAVALCGPGYSDATLLPATLVLCVAAYPYVAWIVTSRPLQVVVIALALTTHAIVWAYSLATYVRLDDEFRARMAILEAAAPGSVPAIPPYSEIEGTFWWYGEEWPRPGPRQVAAIEVFGVRDIDFDPWFRKMERNAGVEVRFEADQLAPAQLAGHLPRYWATDVQVARAQFTGVIDALADAGVHATARLAVVGLAVPELRGRPLLIAFAERGNLVAPSTRRLSPNDDDDYPLAVKPAFARAYPEAYAYVGAAATPVRYEDRRYWVRPMTTERTVVIACDPARCILVDAFVPRL